MNLRRLKARNAVILSPSEVGERLLPLLTTVPPPEVKDSPMHRWLFWLIVFGAMILGSAAIVASVSLFRGQEVKRELLRGFGEALLIAGFIAATVDQYVKRRLLWETSHDISKYLIGYNLPPEIQDQIRELMGTAIIRQGFEQRYV